ncbi:hypothetical protein KR222_009879, partial [Zaprionus bogoriensis]
YDAAGNLSCILCRIPIKPSIWKVHLNSKQHKQFVELAKQQRTENESAPKKVAAKKEQVQQKAPKIAEKTEVEPISVVNTTPLNANGNQASAPNELPEKFFDQDKSAKNNASDADADAEWQKFQREIREAATISNIIVAEEQDNLNIKRHLKEIDEQMENWKKFVKMNNKKDILLNKKRRVHKLIEQEIESSSSEDEKGVDDLMDWRTKSVNK